MGDRKLEYESLGVKKGWKWEIGVKKSLDMGDWG